MTAILYSPEWRDLALAFCEARDAAVYSPSGEAGLPDSQSPNRAVGQAPGSCPDSSADPGAPSVAIAVFPANPSSSPCLNGASS